MNQEVEEAASGMQGLEIDTQLQNARSAFTLSYFEIPYFQPLLLISPVATSPDFTYL